MIARTAMGHRRGVGILLGGILPRHPRGGRVHVHLARLSGDSSEERSRIVLREPVRCPSQAVVV